MTRSSTISRRCGHWRRCTCPSAWACCANAACAPEVPNIACFDTAFHATQPELATRLPLPRAYFDKGYRRYGFHGLNYEHVVEALPRMTGKPLPRRLLAAHLGSGASMCAIFDGKAWPPPWASRLPTAW